MSLSTFLNGRAPTTLRGLLWLSLSEAGVVWHSASTSDTGGGATQAWVNGGTVECRIDPAGGGAGGLVAMRIDERSTHVVTVAPDVVVQAEDRFVIPGRGLAGSAVYEVTAVHEQTTPLANTFEVAER